MKKFALIVKFFKNWLFGFFLFRLRSRKCSLAPPCRRVWTPQTLLWCDHRRPEILRASGSSFHDASGASSLCVLQLAGVASHLIYEVTTGELTLTQGFFWSTGKFRCTNLQRGKRQGVGLRPCPRRGADDREVVADGLPLFHSAQLAVDTTMVSTVRADAPRKQCAERTRIFVVLACGGRWSEEAQSFLRHQARAKAQSF